MNNNVFLDVKNLTIEYSSADKIVHAVNNVSFQLKKGRTLGLVGETGAGKTTIADSIMGILPVPQATVCSGEILFQGENLLDLSEDKLRNIRGNQISMIFQDPMTALNPVKTVGAQIAEAIRSHEKISRANAKERAQQMLEKVGIPARRYSEYPHQFSGGMKQRVIIAMALSCTPDLLLADEPTTALDVTIQAQILEMINELKMDYEMSMILITHDLGVIAKMCDDVCVVYAGEIIESGTVEHIFDNPKHPYTVGLLNSLPKLTKEKEKLTPIMGNMPDPTVLPQGCSFYPRCPYAVKECRDEPADYLEVEMGHFCKCIRERKESYE